MAGISGLRSFLSYVLRILGLHLLTSLASRWKGSEPKKIALRSSHWPIFATFAVHIIPLVASATLFYYNIKGDSLGPNLRNVGPRSWSDNVKLNALQVFAKIHELFVVASVATVVFHYTTKQLVRGDGLPIGLIGAGVSFTQVSWFWSPDFWGGVTYPTSWHVKVKLIGLLVLSGIIALLAGPPSAILMLPRAQDRSSTSDIFLPGTLNQFWPTIATANNTGITLCDPSVGDEELTEACITAGHSSLLGLFADNWIIGPFDVSETLAEQDLLRNISGNVRRHAVPQSQSWAMTPHLAASYLQSAIFSQWVSIYFYSRQRNHATELPARPNAVAGRVPVVRTVCAPPRLMSNSTTSTLFPILSEYEPYGWADGEELYALQGDMGTNAPIKELEIPEQISVLRKAVRSATPDTENYGNLIARSGWVSLPEAFGVATSGLAIMLSTKPHAESPAIMGCTVDVRYAHGHTSTAGSTYILGESSIQSISLKLSALLPTSGTNDTSKKFAPVDDGTWERVHAEADFLDLLTPVYPDTGGNAIDDVLQQNVYPWYYMDNNAEIVGEYNYNHDFTGFVEQLVAAYVADAFSRIGAKKARVFGTFTPATASKGYAYGHLYTEWLNCDARQNANGSGTQCAQTPPQAAAGLHTKLTTTFWFNGYAYSLQGGSAIFALVVLSLHMLVALLHVLDLLIVNRWTASCWDTIPELLTLAQNSTPADSGAGGSLMNTSAGVKRMKTYAAVAKIAVVGKEMANVTVQPNGTRQSVPGTALPPRVEAEDKIMFVFDQPRIVSEVEMDVKY